MTFKLAIHGGKKVRKNPMPYRFAFGKKESQEVSKMLKYYKFKNEVLNIQVFGRKNFVIYFPNS